MEKIEQKKEENSIKIEDTLHASSCSSRIEFSMSVFSTPLDFSSTAATLDNYCSGSSFSCRIEFHETTHLNLESINASLVPFQSIG